MITNLHAAEDALLTALSRVSPLNDLFEPVRYRRELRTSMEPDGAFVMQLDRRGFRRYKNHHQKKPFVKFLTKIDLEKIGYLLNSNIEPHFLVAAVHNEITYIKIYIKKGHTYENV